MANLDKFAAIVEKEPSDFIEKFNKYLLMTSNDTPVETYYDLITQAVEYGFKSAQEGQDIPQGNIDQWLMWKVEMISKAQLEQFKTKRL